MLTCKGTHLNYATNLRFDCSVGLNCSKNSSFTAVTHLN